MPDTISFTAGLATGLLTALAITTFTDSTMLESARGNIKTNNTNEKNVCQMQTEFNKKTLDVIVANPETVTVTMISNDNGEAIFRLQQVPPVPGAVPSSTR